MNIKKDRISFIKLIKKILLENNAELKESNKDYDIYTIKGIKNSVDITLRSEQDHKYIYSVFMRLKTPSKNIGNKFSGKCNYHDNNKMFFNQHLSEVLKELN